jgi:hypothetical protein
LNSWLNPFHSSALAVRASEPSVGSQLNDKGERAMEILDGYLVKQNIWQA